MSETKNPEAFLPFLLTEDIYIIPEAESKEEGDEALEVKEDVPVYKKSGVLVVSEYEDLPADQKNYLAKILAAVGLSLDKVEFKSSKAELENYQKAICFGSNLSTEFSLYTVLTQDETQVLYANSLDEISGSVDLRKKLWASLQILFDL